MRAGRDGDITAQNLSRSPLSCFIRPSSTHGNEASRGPRVIEQIMKFCWSGALNSTSTFSCGLSSFCYIHNLQPAWRSIMPTSHAAAWLKRSITAHCRAVGGLFLEKARKKFRSCGSIQTEPTRLLDWAEDDAKLSVLQVTDQPSLLFMCPSAET